MVVGVISTWDIKYVLYNGFDKLCCSSIAFVDAPIDLLCVFNTTFNNISLILSVTVSVVLLLDGRFCLPTVNTICRRIMIGLSLSSVSKHNMWSEDDNHNPIILPPNIVFTDGRQRQPNHNTTTYCVY
jgi:hypothetical protein